MHRPVWGDFMVGLTGFEPVTSSSRTKRAAGLRYNPNLMDVLGRYSYYSTIIHSQTPNGWLSFPLHLQNHPNGWTGWNYPRMCRASRTRTGDLLIPNQARFQLRHCPDRPVSALKPANLFWKCRGYHPDGNINSLDHHGPASGNPSPIMQATCRVIRGRTRHSVNVSFSTGRNNRLVSGFFPGLEQTHRFVSRPTKLSVRFGRPDLFRTRTPHLFSVILPPPKCGYSGLDCKLKQATARRQGLV